ncbi:hypothetical protein ACWDBD_00155 [Streptomyces sp. NPDC001118]
MTHTDQLTRLGDLVIKPLTSAASSGHRGERTGERRADGREGGGGWGEAQAG